MAKKIGILGGGQLARMLAMSVYSLGRKVCIYTNNEEDCANFVTSESLIGDYTDIEKLKIFAKKCDAIALEFENIPLKTIEILSSEGHQLLPGNKCIEISQSRILEKTFFQSLSLNTPLFYSIESLEDLSSLYENLDLKNGKEYILKTNRFGYDGKGQWSIASLNDLQNINYDFDRCDYILEEKLKFDFEFSVTIARDKNGNIEILPIPINEHVNGILHRSIVRNWNQEFGDQYDEKFAKIRDNYDLILDIASVIANDVNLLGICTVECFMGKDGKIYLNEMAPRPHNSAHWSMNGASYSQFDFLASILSGKSLVKSDLICKELIMVNLIGNDVENLEDIIVKYPGYHSQIYLYDKGEVRNGRKMGHINFIVFE